MYLASLLPISLHEYMYLCYALVITVRGYMCMYPRNFDSEICQHQATNGDAGGNEFLFLMSNSYYPFFKSLSFCITSIGSLKPTAFWIATS